MMTNKEMSKLTMEQLKGVLNANYKAAAKADKALADSITYVAKRFKDDPKSVKKAELIELVKQTMTALGDKFLPSDWEKPKATLKPAVAEASLKPKAKKDEPKAEPKEEEPKKEAPKAEPKKEAKAPAKKDEPKKLENVQSDLATADTFPAELKVGDSTYSIAHDIKDIKDLLAAFSKDEEIIFAAYWSKRLLRQFNYANGLLKAPAKGFEYDLDLSSVLYVSDEGKVCYALSMFTESLYQVMPEAFEEIDGVRYTNAIEFQIYRAVK